MPYSAATSGGSGGLNIPDGRVLQDGAVIVGLNNYREPQFSSFHRGTNDQFVMGVLPYLELSGRLVNYPRDADGNVGLRDLSGNIKIAIPELFRGMPDLAVGMNDITGGAKNFRSTYVSASGDLGFAKGVLGAATGEPHLKGVFAGLEMPMFVRGLTGLAERHGGAYAAGLRYRTPPMALVLGGYFSASLQRSFRARADDGSKADHSSASIQLLIPFGKHATAERRYQPENEPVWTPTPSAAAVGTGGAIGVASTAPAPAIGLDAPSVSKPMALADRITALGLERVKVGMRGKELVIEFENHRYNQNDVDAIGIVLGLSAVHAPAGTTNVTALGKKAGLSMYSVTVDRDAFARFVRDGEAYDVRGSMHYASHPDTENVQWLDEKEGARGWSRVRLSPSLVKYVGTEVGVFDYYLSMNMQAFVPLWKGAELSTSYYRKLAESENFRNGIFEYAREPQGLKSATLTQTVWLGDRVLTVTTAGRMRYGDKGVQNETTFFVPWRDDQIRTQYSRTRYTDAYGYRDTETRGIFYTFAYEPLQLRVEAGTQRYYAQDHGPSLKVSRWFGDVQAQMFVRKSNIETRVGFGLAFPLTPRQGMQPGWTHVEGASNFMLKLETKYARNGECNCINYGIVEEVPMVYSAQGNLLNQGRIGHDYFAGQLARMRQAYFAFASDSPN